MEKNGYVKTILIRHGDGEMPVVVAQGCLVYVVQCIARNKMPIPKNSFPAVPRLKYEEVRGHIQDGDILLCSGNNWFSNLIKRFTGSIWSHVAFILRADHLDRIMVMESVESIGVRTVPLSAYLSNYNGKGERYKGEMLIARHSEFRESMVHALSKNAIDLLGHNYDSGEIARIAARIVSGSSINGCELPTEEDNEYICSEYMDECWNPLGIYFNHSCGYITPADIATDEKVNAVCLLA